MSDDPRPPVRFSAWLAVAVALAVGLAVGVASGNAPGAVVGVVAAAAFGGGTRYLNADGYARPAAGSVAVVAGVVGIVIGPWLAATDVGDGVLVVGVTAAVLMTSIGASVDSPEETVPELFGVFTNSVAAIVAGGFVGAVLVGIALVSPVLVVVDVVVAVGEAIVGSSAYAAIVSFQVLAVATVAVVRAALATIDEWTAEPSDALARLDRYGIAVEDVPREYWTLLGIQVVLPAFVPVADLLAAVLGLLSPVGPLVGSALRSGAVHLPLLVVAVVAGGVLLARVGRGLIHWWAGNDPPASAAAAAGGVAVLPVAAVAAGAVWLVPVPGFAGADPVGVAAGVLGGVVAAIVVVGSLVVMLLLVVASEGAVASVDTGGFAVGSALLLLSAFEAVNEVPAVVAVAGVAGAVLTWDLGRNAAVLDRQVGPIARSREAEITHAVGSILVATVAVAVAAVAAYLVGPIPEVSIGRERALAAFALSLVSLIAFARAIEG